MMRHFLQFLRDLFLAALRGSRLYYAWIVSLLVVTVVGLVAYGYQLSRGLVVTHMTDQVSWGAYIANFTFIVGLAAAAVMLVIPAYIYKIKAIKEIVFIGEFLAIASVLMCLGFVVVDLGHPERAWHMIPGLGRFNFPGSMLAWDVVVLSGYLLINSWIVIYVLFAKYRAKEPNPKLYVPMIFLSMGWAISIHTVTAFLYTWLGGRPYWNAAIITPRFLASAFVSGPAFLIVALQIIRRFAHLKIDEDAFRTLRRIIAVTMLINLFLLGSELFTEFFTRSAHGISARYLFFGIEEHGMLRPYIWTALAFNLFAAVVFVFPSLSRRRALLNLACVLCFIGVWIEKGMGLIVPGFIPTQLGEIVEYTPSIVEILVSAGIWAGGILVFTLMLKVGIPIETGALTIAPAAASTPVPAPAPELVAEEGAS